MPTEQKVSIDGQQMRIETGQTFEQIYLRYSNNSGSVTVARTNKTMNALTDVFSDEKTIDFLAAEDSEEASRVYERGVSFLLYKAVREVFGHSRELVIDHVLSGGLYCEFKDKKGVTPHEVAQMEMVMEKFVQKRAPFRFSRVPLDEAVKYFKADKQEDKVALLAHRPFEYFRLYDLEGLKDYYYGVMVPDTGYLKAFKLFYYRPGFILK